MISRCSELGSDTALFSIVHLESVLQITTDHSTVVRNKREWEESRVEETKVSNEVDDMLVEREDAQAAAKQRIDERNKVCIPPACKHALTSCTGDRRHGQGHLHRV